MGLKKLETSNENDLILDSSHFVIYKQGSIVIIEDKNISPWSIEFTLLIFEKISLIEASEPLFVLFILRDIQYGSEAMIDLLKSISKLHHFCHGALISTWNLQFKNLFEKNSESNKIALWSFLSDVDKGLTYLKNKQKQVDKKESQSNSQDSIYRQIINTAPAILYSCAPTVPFQIQYISDKIQELGFEKELITNNQNFWIDYTHPDDLNDFLNAMANCSLDQTNHIHFRIYDKNGDHRWYKNSFKYVKVEKSDSLWIAGFLLDVTSEVNQKNALNEQRNFLNILLSSMTEGLCGLDLDGNIIFMNPAGCQKLGYIESELIGKNFLTLGFHLKDNGEMRLFKESILHPTLYEGKTSPSDPSVFWRKDRSELHVEFTLSPLIKENHRIGAVVSFTDITEKRKAAAIIESQRASIINSSKLSALGEMAGGIAHEINNPLAGIQGKIYQILRMVESGKMDLEKFKIELKKIYETSDRIAHIIKGLKSFSRNAEKDPFEYTSIKPLIEQALTFTKEKFKSYGVELSVGDLVSDKTISCRTTQLVQVILALLNNSFDAIAVLNEKWIRIETQIMEDKLLQILITDSGSGIKPEIAQKIMQPFFTTKGIGKGVGLGLSAAMGIVNDHGGRLYLDENYKNTRFVIEIPLSDKSTSGKSL